MQCPSQILTLLPIGPKLPQSMKLWYKDLDMTQGLMAVEPCCLLHFQGNAMLWRSSSFYSAVTVSVCFLVKHLNLFWPRLQFLTCWTRQRLFSFSFLLEYSLLRFFWIHGRTLFNPVVPHRLQKEEHFLQKETGLLRPSPSTWSIPLFAYTTLAARMLQLTPHLHAKWVRVGRKLKELISADPLSTLTFLFNRQTVNKPWFACRSMTERWLLCIPRLLCYSLLLALAYLPYLFSNLYTYIHTHIHIFRVTHTRVLWVTLTEISFGKILGKNLKKEKK